MDKKIDLYFQDADTGQELYKVEDAQPIEVPAFGATIRFDTERWTVVELDYSYTERTIIAKLKPL